MKNTLPYWSLLFLLCTANAQAQLYKWVGPDGKVTYTDTPPPPSAKRVETKSVTAAGANTAGFPFELSEAVRGNPVTLYTTTNCGPCDDGRKLLAERGIPYSEKTVISSEDIGTFKKISGDGQLPLLVVGRNKERGFESTTWNTILSSAGYPESNKLPRNYRNPQAEPAAPVAKSVIPTQDDQTGTDRSATTSSATELPPATGNAPPGFRF
jgi:glutaredoxin